MAGLIRCQICNELHDHYSLEELDWGSGEAIVICEKCGCEQKVQADAKNCFSCGSFYWEVLWHLPSHCPRCLRTFVD